MRIVFFIFFIFLASSFVSIAGTFSVFYNQKELKNNDVLNITVSNDEVSRIFLSLLNPDDTSKKIKIVKSEISLSDGTTNSFCYGGICWSGLESDCRNVKPGHNDSVFESTTIVNGISGRSIIEYKFIDCDNESGFLSIVFIFDFPSDVNDPNISGFEIFPSIANDNLILKFHDIPICQRKFKIYDILGNELSDKS